MAFFLEDDAWWLWSAETQREAFRLLVWLAPKLDEGQRTELCNAILTGPPRSMFRDDLETTRWNELVDHEVWLRLEKLKGDSTALTPEAEERHRRLSDKHPQWQLQPEERDEFPTWMESGWGGLWIKRAALPRERRPLAGGRSVRLFQLGQLRP